MRNSGPILARDPQIWLWAALLAFFSLYSHFVWYPNQPSPLNAGRPGSPWAGKEIAFLYAHVRGQDPSGLKLESYGERFDLAGNFPALSPDERVSVKVRVEADGKFTLLEYQRHPGRSAKAWISALGLALALAYVALFLRWDSRKGGLCPT